MRVETLILKNLLQNEPYCRSVLPYIKAEYFTDNVEKAIFTKIAHFLQEYNEQPTLEAIQLILSQSSTLDDGEVREGLAAIDGDVEETNFDWLIQQTEAFCKDRALENAITDSIKIITDKKTKRDRGEIPELLKDALAISFDPSVGHDFNEDYEKRFDFYHNQEERIPFDIDLLNQMTNGGVPRKTLNVILSGTNVGKSLSMCHMATANISQGKNVLYITMEMAEERIAERIDANLLDLALDNMKLISKDQYVKLIHKAHQKNLGKLIIKEYPTSSANVNHFRHLLNELSLKKKFVPDIIYIDYLNICSSSRMKFSPNVNSYTMIKSIAEEIRGLAVEFNVPIFTATQTNRSGFNSSDVELTDTSESFGLPATADLMFALINTEELQRMGQLMVKQLKNRYKDTSTHQKFLVGIDRPKMRLYDLAGAVDVEEEPYVYQEQEPVTPSSPANKFSGFQF